MGGGRVVGAYFGIHPSTKSLQSTLFLLYDRDLNMVVFPAMLIILETVPDLGCSPGDQDCHVDCVARARTKTSKKTKTRMRMRI